MRDCFTREGREPLLWFKWECLASISFVDQRRRKQVVACRVRKGEGLSEGILDYDTDGTRGSEQDRLPTARRGWRLKSTFVSCDTLALKNTSRSTASQHNCPFPSQVLNCLVGWSRHLPCVRRFQSRLSPSMEFRHSCKPIKYGGMLMHGTRVQ